MFIFLVWCITTLHERVVSYIKELSKGLLCLVILFEFIFHYVSWSIFIKAHQFVYLYNPQYDALVYYES